MTPKLSILIPTLISRKSLLDRLLTVLRPQLVKDVEVVLESDDGSMSIGEKRNRLLDRATGEYIAFVDDDDLVSPDYISCLMYGIEQGVDTVSIQGIFTTNGQDPSPFIDKPYQGHGLARVNGHTQYKRGLQHLDATKREIALKVRFQDSSYGEDYEWGSAIERLHLVNSSVQIDHPIYFYDYRTPKERRPSPSLAVVMPCLNHCYLTYRSILSLLEATTDRNFCLILADDGSNDDTALMAQDLVQQLGTARFHYHRNRENLGVNESWNEGVRIARARDAQHIAIVNNDVMFAKGWDAPLVKALSDPTVGVVSPMSTFGAVPSDWPAGTYRNVNPAGYVGYMPLLGCCFVTRADIYDKIGMFPSADLKIYFGDNWLATAVQNLGLQCGYDDASYIHHLFCQTTRHLDSEPLWKSEGPAFDRIIQERGWLPMVPFVEAP